MSLFSDGRFTTRTFGCFNTLAQVPTIGLGLLLLESIWLLLKQNARQDCKEIYLGFAICYLLSRSRLCQNNHLYLAFGEFFILSQRLDAGCNRALFLALIPLLPAKTLLRSVHGQSMIDYMAWKIIVASLPRRAGPRICREELCSSSLKQTPVLTSWERQPEIGLGAVFPGTQWWKGIFELLDIGVFLSALHVRPRWWSIVTRIPAAA